MFTSFWVIKEALKITTIESGQAPNYIKIMNIKYLYLVTVLAFSTCVCFAKEKYGATVPWTTYEAEHMKTNGTALDPKYGPYQVETESSGQKCVKLNAKGQFVEFTSSVIANSLIIRSAFLIKKKRMA